MATPVPKSLLLSLFPILISSTRTATYTTSTMGPTPTDTVAGCYLFCTITDSDNYATVETKFDITLEQFYQWNPSILAWNL
ncbi:hypothetical protein PENANT_c025G00671 [Penicillium antarcticum]|uniref:LysM domain-containing protein n=1 Tax=Penicillium antarcticum TaxID=416450 RepID=A0A1V6PXK5_9EURO|nr:hypothetical protein PENANT_c025G00671 [Penicillium antarcticum]